MIRFYEPSLWIIAKLQTPESGLAPRAAKSAEQPESAGPAKNAEQPVSAKKVGAALAFMDFLFTGMTPKEITALSSFAKLKPAERIEASRRIVQSCIIDASEVPDRTFVAAIDVSENLLPG